MMADEEAREVVAGREGLLASDGAGVGPAKPDEPVATSGADQCPIDAAPCHLLRQLTPALYGVLVAQALARGLEGEGLAREVREQAEAAAKCLRRFLPCSWCRAGQHALAGLPRTRLGRLQRQVLLRAAPAGGALALVEADTRGRAVREALRRAVATLVQAALVEVQLIDSRYAAARGLGAYSSGHCRMIRRTPAGDVVVTLLGDHLREGRRIRWEPHLPVLQQMLHAAPDDLLRELRGNLDQARRAWAEMARDARSLQQCYQDLLQAAPPDVRALFGSDALMPRDPLDSRGHVDTLSLCLAVADSVLGQLSVGDSRAATDKRCDEPAGVGAPWLRGGALARALRSPVSE